jgi:hypothetical protein
MLLLIWKSLSPNPKHFHWSIWGVWRCHA